MNKYNSLLIKNDHPELDTSDLLDNMNKYKYQSIIGVSHWLTIWGNFYIFTAIMTFSHFRFKPRNSYLDRMKRIYSYVKNFSCGSIRVRVDMPDYSNFPD